jgi:hypothetical protein
MTRQATTRIGFYLLATFLFALQIPRMSLAQEATNQAGAVTAPGADFADHANGTGNNGRGKVDPPKPESVKSEPTKPEATSSGGGHEAGGKPEGTHTNAPANDGPHFGQARDPGPIDTHVAPPSRHNDNRFSVRDSRGRFKIGSSSRPRPVTGHAVTGPVTRNSIGLAVPPQPNKLDRDSKLAEPVITPAATAPGASIPAVKTESPVGHLIAVHPNVSVPVAINGSMIGGNLNIRRGSAPASIGGQTRTASGINGSTIPRRVR